MSNHNKYGTDRLAALKATERFEEGTIGSGVHRGIRDIYYGPGNYIVEAIAGQPSTSLGLYNRRSAEIGSFFQREDIQELMNRPISDEEANLAIATEEYEYWESVLNDPTASKEDIIGAELAVRFSPEVRAQIQEQYANGDIWGARETSGTNLGLGASLSYALSNLIRSPFDADAYPDGTFNFVENSVSASSIRDVKVITLPSFDEEDRDTDSTKSTNFTSRVFSKIEETIDKGIDIVERAVDGVVDIVDRAIDGIGDFVEKVADGIGGLFRSDPIVLDLDGDGVEIITTPNIAYDVDGDGYLEQTTWAASDDGFLVIDREANGSRGDGDGIIDQTKEIFISEVAGDKNYTDLQALAQYDLRSSWGGNNDGKLTSADDVWQNLHVWQDENQDGNVDSNELKTLAQWDITQINVSYDDGSSFGNTSDDINVFGSILRGTGSFRMDGETITGGVGDVSLLHTVRGWRETRSENSITIEIEGGDHLYLKEIKSSDPSNIDLREMNLDGVVGDERANTLSAENVQNKEISISGGDGNDTITGSSNSDFISGDAGADELYGGSGNDLIFLDASDTIVEGGSGWDTAVIRSNTQVRLELHETGFEVAYGGSGSDVLTAKGSYEDLIIHGGEGYDSLFGGHGGDRISGDNGNDELWGRDGDDVLFGGLDDDTLRGEKGDDQIDGGKGDDNLRGGEDDDWLLGGDGADELSGAEGDDILDGGSGNDDLDGGIGDDVLLGGLGNDTLRWRRGDAFLDGGEGNDEFYINDKPENLDEVPDSGFWGYPVFQGGKGEDTLYLFGYEWDWEYEDIQDGSKGVAQWHFTYDHQTAHGRIFLDLQDIEQVVFQHGGNPQTVRLEDEERSEQDNSQSYYRPQPSDISLSSNKFVGIRDDNVPELIADKGRSVLNAFSTERPNSPDYETWMGNDVFVDGENSTSIHLGIGDDTALGGDNNDTLYGNGGSDALFGESGNDILTGHAGSDRLDGEAGNDKLYGKSGSDLLNGGDGNDTLSGLSGSDELSGNNGNDELKGGFGKDLLYGNEGDDLLQGDRSSDLLSGGDDNDTLLGNSGFDQLYGNEGNDELDGGSGFDYLDGGDDDDTLTGGDDNDELFGGDGADSLYGGDGDDVLRGGNGADLVYGGNGNDVVYYRNLDRFWTDAEKNSPRNVGQDGYDTLIIEEGFDFQTNNLGKYGFEAFVGAEEDDKVIGELDEVDYYLEGGAGDDSLESADGNDELFGGEGEDTLRGHGGNDELYGGDDNDILNGGDRNDTLEGGAGSDKLYGKDGNDSIEGGTGDDYISGLTGDDTLKGNEGDDELRGGKGNDTLTGNEGNDTLYGNDGDDVFRFYKGNESDLVVDFENNIDTIDIDRNITGISSDDVGSALSKAEQIGSDVLFDFGSGDILTVENATIAQLEDDLSIF